ncbi:MAG TPA: 2TM domain-containing protein [Arenibacter sp.]|nr:2TM domain-containing protein [Arenibacter sp.]
MEQRESKYLRAKERVLEIKKFYSSLFSSLIVILFVAGLNYYLNQWRHPWFLWVIFGLGIGMVFKTFKTFGYDAFFGRNWERRKIREFLEKEEQGERWE